MTCIHLSVSGKSCIYTPHTGAACKLLPLAADHANHATHTCIVPSSQYSMTRCVFQLSPAAPPPLDSPDALPPSGWPNRHPDNDAPRSSNPIVKLVKSCTMFGWRRFALSQDSYSCCASSSATCAAWLSIPAGAPVVLSSGCSRASCCCCGCVEGLFRKVRAEGCLTWMTLTATTEPHQTPAGRRIPRQSHVSQTLTTEALHCTPTARAVHCCKAISG